MRYRILKNGLDEYWIQYQNETPHWNTLCIGDNGGIFPSLFAAQEALDFYRADRMQMEENKRLRAIAEVVWTSGVNR